MTKLAVQTEAASPSGHQVPGVSTGNVSHHGAELPSPAAAAAAASALFAPAQQQSAADARCTRASRGSFEQPQNRARNSFEQHQNRARGSFDQPQSTAKAIPEQPPSRGRSGLNQHQAHVSPRPGQNSYRGHFSFDDAQNSSRTNTVTASGRPNAAQLQAAARSSLDQLQARAAASQAPLRAIPEQGSVSQHPSDMVHHWTPFSHLPESGNALPQYPFGQFVNPVPNPRHPYSLQRASCDYPQPGPGAKASADFPRAQGSFVTRLDRAASSDAPVSRQSVMASWEFAMLDEATKRRAAAAALGVTNIPPNHFWSDHSPRLGPPPERAGSGLAPWSAEHSVDRQSCQPHVLQLHALNTLNAINRSSQHMPAQPDFWSQASQTGFPAADTAFPSTPPATVPGNTSPAPVQTWSQDRSNHHSFQKYGGNGPRTASTDAGANASDLQGAWGAHLDASDSNPTPKGGSARRQPHNPFLQPQAPFSIREAKLQLQNPSPKDQPEGVCEALGLQQVFHLAIAAFQQRLMCDFDAIA